MARLGNRWVNSVPVVVSDVDEARENAPLGSKPRNVNRGTNDARFRDERPFASNNRGGQRKPALDLMRDATLIDLMGG